MTQSKRIPAVNSVTVVPGRWIWFNRGQLQRQHYLTFERVNRLFDLLSKLGGKWSYPSGQLHWER